MELIDFLLLDDETGEKSVFVARILYFRSTLTASTEIVSVPGHFWLHRFPVIHCRSQGRLA